jgi:hypothetical protein
MVNVAQETILEMLTNRPPAAVNFQLYLSTSLPATILQTDQSNRAILPSFIRRSVQGDIHVSLTRSSNFVSIGECFAKQD